MGSCPPCSPPSLCSPSRRRALYLFTVLNLVVACTRSSSQSRPRRNGLCFVVASTLLWRSPPHRRARYRGVVGFTSVGSHSLSLGWIHHPWVRIAAAGLDLCWSGWIRGCWPLLAVVGQPSCSTCLSLRSTWPCVPPSPSSCRIFLPLLVSYLPPLPLPRHRVVSSFSSSCRLCLLLLVSFLLLPPPPPRVVSPGA